MAAGTDFLLSALGIPKDQIDALKTFLDPDNLKTIFGDLKTRFDAMEARNIEMHQILSAMVVYELPVQASGATVPEDNVLHAEMDRQTVLFETQARTLEHG